MQNLRDRFLSLFINRLYTKKVFSILTIAFLLAAVPLTVYIAQQQQEIRQRASESDVNNQLSIVLSDLSDGNELKRDDGVYQLTDTKVKVSLNYTDQSSNNPFGKSLRFPNVQQNNPYIIIPHSESLMPSLNYTIEMWVKLSPSQNSSAVLIQKGSHQTNDFSYSLTYIPQWRALRFSISDGSCGYPRVVDGTILSPEDFNIWRHIAVVIQDGTVRIYEDGAKINTTGLRIPGVCDRGGQIILGGYRDHTNTIIGTFLGEFDDIRLQNQVIYTEYQTNMPVEPLSANEHTKLLYHFNGDLLDTSGNNNHGQLTGTGTEYVNSSIQPDSVAVTPTPTPTYPFGQALQLSGNSCLDTRDILAVGMDTFSVSGWIKPSGSYPRSGKIITNDVFAIEQSYLTLYFKVYNNDRDCSNIICRDNYQYAVASVGGLQYNQWFYFMAVKEQNRLRLFVNGRESTAPLTFGPLPTPYPGWDDTETPQIGGTTIGCLARLVNNRMSRVGFYSGVIDDITITNSVISNPEQIPTSPSPSAIYNFEGSLHGLTNFYGLQPATFVDSDITSRPTHPPVPTTVPATPTLPPVPQYRIAESEAELSTVLLTNYSGPFEYEFRDQSFGEKTLWIEYLINIRAIRRSERVNLLPTELFPTVAPSSTLAIPTAPPTSTVTPTPLPTATSTPTAVPSPSPSPTPTRVPGTNASISAETIFPASPAITVNWSLSNPNRGAWIALARPNDGPRSYVNWIWANICQRTGGEPNVIPTSGGLCFFPKPTTPGVYEMRLYGANNFTILARSQQFQIATVSIDTSNVSTVKIQWNLGIANRGSWIAIAKPNTPHTSFNSWVWANTCVRSNGEPNVTPRTSGECTIQKPTAAGNYEIRLFGMNGFDNPVAYSSQFTISSAMISVEKTTQSLIARWNLPTANRGSWISISPVGSGNRSFMAWVWANTCVRGNGEPNVTPQVSGTCTLNLPTRSGSYELRLYAANDFTITAKSTPFTIP